MNILVLAATQMEIEGFQNWIKKSPFQGTCKFLITGPGIFFTTLYLSQTLSESQYDYLIQAGIAGSFKDSDPLGKVYQITEEIFGDFGARDHEKFLDIFSLGLCDPNQFPFQDKKLKNPNQILNLPVAKGITVNCASGDEETISRMKAQFDPGVETFEGAAFFYLGLDRNIPFFQIRAISNLVEPRNRLKWNIPLAIQSLNQTLIEVFMNINSRN